MERKQKILKHINKNGQGLEIAPSYNPIAPKREGYRVHIVDRLSREQLREKCRSLASRSDSTFSLSYQMGKIEQVDFIWGGGSFRELTGRQKFYDWIIASHQVRPVPDLIGFLNDCGEIMKDDAVISLVIADKRFCLDRLRPVSGTTKIIDAHFGEGKSHSLCSSTDYCLSTDALEGITKAGAGQFLDVHSWCFTPHSFRLMIHDLYCLGLIPFREVESFPTEGGEFFITLSRNGKGLTESRPELLSKIESEFSEMPLRRLEPVAKVSVMASLLNYLKRRLHPYEMRRRAA